MYDLRIIKSNNFEKYAKENNLEILCRYGDNLTFEIKPSIIVINEKLFAVPPVQLSNSVGSIINLPNAIIRGKKLATIYNNDLLPSGYSHSFNWVEINGFKVIDDQNHCSGPNQPNIEVFDDGLEYFVLGITSHFGHFFVDCLDRLLAIDSLNKNLKDVRFIVDEKPIPQIMQMINLLGFKVDNFNFTVLKKDHDYKFNNLKIASLNSKKPSISLSSFKKFRNRMIEKIENHVKINIKGIYVGRKSVEKRKIINQKEVENYMSTLGISSFYPEDHDFLETSIKFNSAEIVIIAIGSSKFNLSMCRPRTKIICLTPMSYVENSGPVAIMLRQLCSIFELDLCFCSCDIIGEVKGLDSDIKININSLNVALKQLGII